MKRNKRISVFNKRIISFATALMLGFGVMPTSEIGERIEEISDAMTYQAYAVASTASSARHSFNSVAQFVDYARGYTAENKQDVLVFAFGSGSTSGEFKNLNGDPFVTMATTPEAAFEGKIVVGDISFNLPDTMFGYVTDDVQIVDNSANAQTLKFTRTQATDDSPLFAEHIIHKSGNTDPAELSFEYNKIAVAGQTGQYDVFDFAGYIGTIEADAKVNVTSIVHNNKGRDASGDITANIVAPGDAGLVCCTMAAGAELTIGEITVSGANATGAYSVRSSSSGNAGGLVGTMAAGSTLTLGQNVVNPQSAGNQITAASGYAGGIVGSCNGGKIVYNNTAAYEINQIVTGSNGAGGVAGYFSPSEDRTYTLGSKITLKTEGDNMLRVNGTGHCGAVFGEVSSAYNITIEGSTDDAVVNVKHMESDPASSFGGLIGKYTSSNLAKALTITASKQITAYRSGAVEHYGGLVGEVSGSTYVSISGVKVNSNNANGTGSFGGLVGTAPLGFIDVSGENDIDYSGVSTDNTFGGVVGSLANGVLRLRGTTDLRGAANVTSASALSGQIVGYRDCGLVFADTTVEDVSGTPTNVIWKLKRQTIGQKIDDIGSWGEVLNYGGTLTLSELFTNYSTIGTDHYVTIAAAVPSMGTVNDFARTALNIQLNDAAKSTGVIHTSGTTNLSSALLSSSLAITADIALTGTGLTGLTRDDINNTDHPDDYITFKGTFNGNNKSITFSTGQEYGYSQSSSYGNGIVYKHSYIGLFGKTENNGGTAAQISNLNISASSSIKTQALDNMYVGNIVGQAKGSLTLDGVDIKSGAAINHAGSFNTYNIGGLVGHLTSAGTVEITGCTYSGTITGNSTNYNNGSGAHIGGLIGLVNESDTFTINLTNTDLKGSVVSNDTRATHQMGGAIGVITTNTNPSSGRKVNIQNLKIDGLSVSAGGTCGGLLGYAWYKTDVEFTSDNGLKVGTSSAPSVSNSGTKAAGLMLIATGYWKANTGGIDIEAINVTANNAASFGLIVNEGYYKNDEETWGDPDSVKSSAIYLELAPSAFTVTGDTLSLSAVTVFDELVAKTGPNADVLANGQGIVSINTYSSGDEKSKKLKMGTNDSANTGVTYKHQTNYAGSNSAKKYNSNSRYYYNLDAYRSSPSGNVQNFLMWSVKEYAHPSIQGYFNSSYTDTIGSSDSEFNMRGYSYYPVDIRSADSVTIKGKYTLYNTEFDETENDSTNRDVRLSLDNTTQHYTMQNGLFRNVNGTLEVQDTELYGTVNVDYTDNGSGALVRGTVSSDSSIDPAEVKIESLKLAGIKVDNLGATKHGGSGTYDYAPLLINKAGSNATITFKNETAGQTSIENTNAYSSKGAGASTFIASSLLGKMGSTTAQNLKISFENIKLDGRDSAGVTALSGLNTIYNSTGCLFKEAILLDELCYADSSGSQGVYNFTYEQDWDSTSYRNVTYGYEIKGSAENDGKQKKYYGSWETSATTTERYVRPDSAANVSSEYDFTSGFMKYVKPYSGETTGYKASAKTHELRVNIKGATFTGCGTYNDPYIITEGGDLTTIANLINGADETTTIRVPASLTSTWCSDKTDASGHLVYTRTSGSGYTATWTETGSTTITGAQLAEYLAGAYYKLDPNATITLESTFPGISSDVSEEYVFRGVIDGSGNTIYNKTPNPLIVSSNGSVIYNLKLDVNVPSASTRVLYQKNSLPFASSGNYDTSSANGARCAFYGAVIGQILGGDNIIDDVEVKFTGTIIDANSATKAQLVPIGGYVGVVVNGGLIFREMTGTAASGQAGISASNLSGFSDGTGTVTSSTNKKWLYVNPIIGRVLNGYAVTESDAYRPFEDGKRKYGDGSGVVFDGSGFTVVDDIDNYTGTTVGVTMRNGTKNYSIADISTSESKLSVTSGKKITADSAQAFFLMSVIVNSGIGMLDWNLNSNSLHDVGSSTAHTAAASGKSAYDITTTKSRMGYYTAYCMTRNSDYKTVGTAPNTSDPSYDDVYNWDKTGVMSTPYIVKNYTVENTKYYAKCIAYSTNTTEITINSGKASNVVYYLPDGYKGIGNNYMTIKKEYVDHPSGTPKSLTYYELYQDLYLYASKLSGNGATISQNTSVYYYHKGKDLYDYYGAFSDFQTLKDAGAVKNGNSNASLNAADKINRTGVGLFNYQPQAATFEKLHLTGNVLTDVIQTNGDPYPYTTANYKVETTEWVLSAGSLIGSATADQTLKSVSLNNIKVEGPKYTGGMIGNLPSGKITLSNDEGYDSDEIRVHGGAVTGGLIGRHYQGASSFDFNNHKVDIVEVTSQFENINNSGLTLNDANFYNYGLGGLIGTCRAGNNKITLLNANVGSTEQSALSIISCKKANIYTGGMFGILNRAYLDMQNCTVYNLSIDANFAAGGIAGHWATSGNTGKTRADNAGKTSIISNVSVVCTLPDATVKSTGAYTKSAEKKFCTAGGFLGSGKEDMFDVNIAKYTIEGYGYAGGYVGSWGDNSTYGGCGFNDHILMLVNDAISDCKVESKDSTGSAGGLLGNLNDGHGHDKIGTAPAQDASNKGYATAANYYLYGYNIYTEDVNVIGTNKGAVCGRNGHAPANCIKIVGFTRQGSNAKITEDVVGKAYTSTWTSASAVSYADNANLYGTDESGNNGYVVFADYNNAGNKKTGTDSEDKPVYAGRNEMFSNVLPSGTNVTTMRSKTTTVVDKNDGSTPETTIVYGDYSDSPGTTETTTAGVTTTVTVENENFPYVTTSPKYDISATQYLTGDGVSDLRYIGSTAKTILEAIGSTTNNKRYQNTGIAADSTAYADLRDFLAANMSEFTKQTDNASAYLTAGGKDFPVLVVNDTYCDTVLTNYIRLLTNTNYEYGKLDLNDVYSVNISKWKYDEDDKEWQQQSGEASLKRDNTAGTSSTLLTGKRGFYITTTEVDNTSWQISLVDVQFKDPGSSNIAYHLYIPVVVKKMMHYNVYIRMSSGTTYDLDSSAYPASLNNMIENLGNPVTAKVTFEYVRSAAEWTEAINSGENVMRNYEEKYLTFKADNDSYPTGAKLVLVDPNGDKDSYYYGDFASTNDPHDFSNRTSTVITDVSDNTGRMYLENFDGFAYTKLNDLMTIQVNNTAAAADKHLIECPSSEATVCVKNGKNDDGVISDLYLKYNTEGSGDYAVEVTNTGYIHEDYFLSIFTNVNNTDSNIYHYEIDSCPRFKSDVSYPSAKVNDEDPPHLFLGNLFDNDITLEETNTVQELTRSNNYIGADLTAHVGFTANAVAKNIMEYINNDYIHIYQTFMVSLNKIEGSNGTRGILLDPRCTPSDYSVSWTSATDVTNSFGSDSNLKDCTISSNYIELTNDYDLKGALSKVATQDLTETNYIKFKPDGITRDYTVEIKASINMVYDASLLEQQFPESDGGDGDGTYMIGYSNLSPSSTNASASRASKNTDPTHNYKYYISGITAVDFNYRATENAAYADTGKNGNYGQLGINANELGEEEDCLQINTAAYYNAFNYSLKNRGNYVKIKVWLSKKSDYSTPLRFDEYITDFQLIGNDGNADTDLFNIDTSAAGITVTTPSAGVTVIEKTVGTKKITVTKTASEYTFIVPKEYLNTLSDDYYEIPITFKAYSGSGDNFEGRGNEYSNYRMNVEVGMLENEDDPSYLSYSNDTDWVVYTNARLISDVITP